MKAVLFDLDRTLLDRDTAFAKYAEEVWAISKVSVGTEKKTFMSRFVHLDARGRGDKRSMFQTLVSEFLPDCDANTLLETFESVFPTTVAPFGDAIPLLEALRKEGILTGIVSNGRRKFQRAKLASSGLLTFFDVVIISEEVGFRKPDSRIFHIALDSLRCAAEEVMFIGDSEETDIRGAKAVGMFAVLRRYPDEDFATEADKEIFSLGEVLPLVHSASTKPTQ